MLSVKQQVFLEVARQKNFTRASEILFLSQPAITKNIQSLEKEYEARLFERQGKKVELTEIGRVLFDYLLKIETLLEQANFDISYLKGSLHARGLLKLGASTTVALYIVPPILSAFHKQYPQIEISLLNRNSDMVLDALLQKKIQLGIIEGPQTSKEVDFKSFVTDKVVAVCNSKSYLAKKKIITLPELLSIPIVLREKGSGTLDALTQELARYKINIGALQVKVRLGGTEALKNFLLESDSLGFLPERAITKEVNKKDLTILPLEKLNITRNFYFIQRKGEGHGKLNKLFIALAKKMYNQGL